VLPGIPIGKCYPSSEDPAQSPNKELFFPIKPLLVALEKGLHEFRRDEVKLDSVGKIGDGGVELGGDLLGEAHSISAGYLRLDSSLYLG
jgi:hypothetical protein